MADQKLIQVDATLDGFLVRALNFAFQRDRSQLGRPCFRAVIANRNVPQDAAEHMDGLAVFPVELSFAERQLLRYIKRFLLQHITQIEDVIAARRLGVERDTSAWSKAFNTLQDQFAQRLNAIAFNGITGKNTRQIVRLQERIIVQVLQTFLKLLLKSLLRYIAINNPPTQLNLIWHKVGKHLAQAPNYNRVCARYVTLKDTRLAVCVGKFARRNRRASA